MRTFLYESKQHLPVSREELFPFFADAHNLGKITPPWLDFEVLTPAPIHMAPGALIDYRLRWRGFPLRWRTEITDWQPPFRFVDEQVKGPYRLWRHEHVFAVEQDGTAMSDRIEYAVPGGAIVHRLFVGRDVERIFAHRRRILETLFT